MNIKTALLLFFSGSLILNAQPLSEEGTIARVGSNSVSAKEFLYRYELTPQLFRENRNIKLELKREFLYSLIAEKLLSQYAEESAIDTVEIVKKTIKSYEEMFVRDALYKEKIESKINVKKDSLLDIYLSGASKVFVTYLSNSTEQKTNILYNYLASGISFDSLYSELPDSSKDTLMLIRGQMDKRTEEQIFGLEEGSFSNPVHLSNGWHIFKLLSGYNPVLQKSEGWETEFKHLQKLAKTRAEYDLYKAYMLEFFGNVNAQANAKLLKSLGIKIYRLLADKKIESDLSQRIFLEPYDLLKIKNQLGDDTLSMSYVKFSHKEIILDEFIDFFRFENFFVDTLDYRKVLGILNSKTRKYIEYELLTEEGYRQGLQNSSEVKENLRMWRDNYFSQLVASRFLDSVNVSDNDLREYLNKTKKGKYNIKKVNIVELFTDSLGIAEQVLNKLNEGKNLEDLDQLFSENEIEKIESGYFPVTSRGEIGKLADKMNIGDVYGPINYESGYLIFKLIGSKKDSLKHAENIAAFEEEINQNIKFYKSREFLNQFIAKLANKYSFSVNEGLLESIGVTSISSVLYNYLGFGGRILAVPLLTPNMEWVKVWENIQYNP